MFEFEPEIRGRHIHICVKTGAEPEEFDGVVKRVYSNFISLIEDNTGDMVFINQEQVSFLSFAPEEEKLDEKKKRKLFG